MSTSFPKTSTDSSSEITDTVAAINTPCLLSLTSLSVAAVKNLELALIPATIEGLKVTALLDSGASDVYLSVEIAQRLYLEPSGPLMKVTLASDSVSTVSEGFVTSAIKLVGREYSLDFTVVKGLCTNVIYGAPFVKILYLTDLAQKLLSLRIFSYHCAHLAISAQR